jgi:2-alkenal reductase
VVSDSGDSQGSGFVYDLEGHILTNYHVVSDATELEVRFPSGYKVFGEIVGTDLDSDVAVVKVDAPAEELHPLPLGDSDGVKVGQVVIAIGTPFQFNGTMTLGIVSALGRTLASLHQTSNGGNFIAGDIIQTDAAIDLGNSGGPLLNLNGEVIGINRAIVTENITTLGQPVNSGLGFSVSINIVKRVAPHLIAEGSYDYPYVGINSLDLSEFTLAIQEELNLPRSTGVYITRVVEGGPADRAGFRGDRAANDTDPFTGGGDLIIAIDGQPVITYGDFIGYLIKNKSPNDTVVLTVLRDGQEMDLKLTLGTRPSP